MVINRNEMKRKRKEDCSSPLLDESPKRTKVHAQRKFAQGSNVNSPVITPVKEIENHDLDVLPEPVELLPIKRPNTEDFLTFLCFRGTPILPPSLNFFNTASIVDTNGQVHEIKSESPKNGPIDTSVITKTGSGSSERPFVAFGVRKRADPIVISRQMDKKRRHALALQALRRKYQEQRMAKIRAVTISKLSEKAASKTLLRLNSVSKTETLTKKSGTLQKSKITDAPAKQEKIPTRSVKTALRPQIKQKMCLRSFRGRFVQKELQFRNVKKRPLIEKKIVRTKVVKKNTNTETNESSEYSSDDEKPLSKTSKDVKLTPKVIIPKIAKKSAPGPKKPSEINFRITRSNKFLNSKIVSRRQQLKQRMIMTTPTTIVKPRTLRSHTAQNSKLLPETKQKIMKLKQKAAVQKEIKNIIKKESAVIVKKALKVAECLKKDLKESIKKDVKESIKKDVKESIKKDVKESIKKDVKECTKKDVKECIKRDVKENVKKDVKESVKKDVKESVKKDVKESINKDGPKVTEVQKKVMKPTENLKKSINNKPPVVAKKENVSNPVTNKSKVNKPELVIKKEISENMKKAKVIAKPVPITVLKKVVEQSIPKKENVSKKKASIILKKEPKTTENTVKKEAVNKKDVKMSEDNDKKEDALKVVMDQKEAIESKTTQRPTRKTKEAAAIYMEILSHKLVNESKIDDDNVSIDSFPELPNVKKTEQRENELKAKAKSCKTSESEGELKKNVTSKEKEVEVIENKNLRSSDKKKTITQKKNENLEVKKIENNTEKSEKAEDAKKTNELLLVKKKINVEDEFVKEESKKVVENVHVCDRKTRSTNHEKLVEKSLAPPLEKIKEVELKVHINPINVDAESKKLTSKVETKESSINVATKKKHVEKINTGESSESDVSVKQLKVQKLEEKTLKPAEGENTKRQTRNTAQSVRHVDSDDSDESFLADIRVPRKKQVTRGKVSKSCESQEEKMPRTNVKVYKESSSSDSDHSTTSDVDIKHVKPVNKNKKFTKTRNQQKSEQSFSDSDEEPLSKLTQGKNTEVKEVSSLVTEESNLEKKVKLEVETKPVKIQDKEVVDEIIEKEHFKKPKRECAKRPQNYLPMFSSSDEDDNYFHGFKAKNEVVKPTKPVKVAEVICSHTSTSLDLSCKDIGRRFGKGKVNMSNEQIEKWLKDSAMAGNSVKSENDAMLKFGEKIPTDTSHSIATSIDTEKLKSLLIAHIEKTELEAQKKGDAKSAPAVILKSHKNNVAIKPSLTDRKLIFRNKMMVAAPNINAFSASNESSVYAFGEETEDIMKTPFRRPTRRPSSTATSRSEDESSKYDDVLRSGQFRKPSLVKQDSVKSNKESFHGEETSEDIAHVDADDSAFFIPLQPQKIVSVSSKGKILLLTGSQKLDKKPIASTSMVPPSSVTQKFSYSKHHLKQHPRTFDKNMDSLEEAKYKVPSSPSASSSSSAKLYKRQTCKPKFRAIEVFSVKLPEFPVGNPCGQLIEAPTFHPTDKEFQDPLEYIEKIRAKAEQFGICRIVPPSTFKPECKVTDDMRFTAYNQYVHKMLHRWGPNFKELMAIKRYLSTQNISLTHPPWIGGMEIDLPRLYQTVQSLGGLKEVIEKKKWPKVSDAMKIPKSAQDRVTKLDDIYCKYLLPYDTLSPAEREKLFDEVETEWAKRESKSLLKAQQNIEDDTNEVESESDDEAEECIVKGRSMALNAFYRIARNTMSMWFRNSEPLAQEVEQEFWKHVTLKQNHICVHSGSIDSGSWGYGFAVSKNSPFARHAWNLKVLTNNSGSVLRSLGPIMGVTVPTLHVGMVFSSCCWYRDPHSLPWIEYLHTGGNKIWYGIPNSTSASFHTALKNLVPNYCRNKSLWLPSDTVMVPPNLLVENGVSLCRIVQEPGQFIVVFPKVFTSCLSTGYVVSESVYFAPPYWLKTARTVFDELRNSCEPSMFSLDRLLLSIVTDARSNVEVLKQIIPVVQELCDKEKTGRTKIKSLGVNVFEKLPLPEAPNARKKKKLQDDDGDYECEICRMSLFVSMVTESQEDGIYCLDHAAEYIEKKKILSKHCKLTYTYDDQELEGLVNKIHSTIANKMQKKIVNKYAGMPTLLTS